MEQYRLSPKKSSLVYGFCVFIFIFFVFLSRFHLRKNLITLALSGFLGSMVFFFTIVFIGHLFERLGVKEKPGLLSILCSCLSTFIFCMYIDPICCLYCVFFAFPMVIYFFKASNMKTPQYFGII